MDRFTLDEDTIREGLEQAVQSIDEAGAVLRTAQADHKFWLDALKVFEAAKARAKGPPVPAASPKQRGLYEGSAAHQIVSLLHSETEMEYDDLVTAMLTTEWATGLQDAFGAIERALVRLIKRDFVEKNAEVLIITDAGLAAARISTDGSAPTRGALDDSGRESPMDPP
ncbi:MAG: hypothetical protein IH941_12715 [Acidobacteria bacterium]|nr:hypothetical protein [Acidobacteriota bacterium]